MVVRGLCGGLCGGGCAEGCAGVVRGDMGHDLFLMLWRSEAGKNNGFLAIGSLRSVTKAVSIESYIF